MPTSNPELLPGTLDRLILKTLTRGPNHGYGIAQYIQRISEDALRIGEGSLYPALQRLLISEWVRAEWGGTIRLQGLTRDLSAFRVRLDPRGAPVRPVRT